MSTLTVGPAGRFALPWQRAGGVLPARRGMPSSAPFRPRPERVSTREEYRLESVDRPGLPPHYHVVRTAAPVSARPWGIGLGLQPWEQSMVASLPRGLLGCEASACDWYFNGREGIDEGEPFAHPAGVECGDEARCLDANCPCPQRVIEWPDGTASGHIVPCRFCNGRYRMALPGPGSRPALLTGGFDEYFYRLDEGADALVTILTRGV